MIKSPDDQRSRFLIILMGFSFLLWCYLFRSFLNGSSPLQGDASPYLGHVRFYLENITRGVYPLWDPFENHGNVNEFFLRRIGEFNPFFWTIVFLNKIGLPFVIAHRVFLVMYYFLGVIGFYLLSRKIFSDRLSSFTAMLLLLFSCVGASIFESYILLEIVPFIWFFYFLVAFTRNPQKVFLLGIIFNLMIINITYIPFYFYTIFFVLLICYFVVYVEQLGAQHRQINYFIGRHKFFTGICICLLVVSFVPGISWYHQAARGEALTMQRHTGSQYTNCATVSIDKINEGGIIPDFIFDRQFLNLDKIKLEDFYAPLFTFLMLFAGLGGYLNRRLVVFFIFGFTIFLIGLADASYAYRFLYKFVPFFRYFRNVQFFLQFVILPVFIFFIVEQMRIFIEDCKRPLVNRKWTTLWLILVHGCALAVFACNHLGCITYVVVIFNLGWMLGRLWSVGNPTIWILLLWGAIILQPFEVYSHVAADNPPTDQWGYDKEYSVALPSVKDVGKITNLKKKSKGDASPEDIPYFGTRWLYEAVGSVDNAILKNYLSVPFIVYNRVEEVTDKIDIRRLQDSLARFQNIAFVYADTMYKTEGHVDSKARVITSADEDFKVLRFDANDVVARTAFITPSFLVRTQNYYSQWNVFIDGKPAPLYRTNICAQGLWVPPGNHVIHWHFGGEGRLVWVYFLLVLYPLVLIWLIWSWYLFKASTQKLLI